MTTKVHNIAEITKETSGEAILEFLSSCTTSQLIDIRDQADTLNKELANTVFWREFYEVTNERHWPMALEEVIDAVNDELDPHPSVLAKRISILEDQMKRLLIAVGHLKLEVSVEDFVKKGDR